ncbi:iron chelate uptake ABC transporter family permease subunit [Otariodibacter oris]|uniref:Iron complex transport system permease protein n=1 Tax=Otariodibacter oris TaxID=1032623 RepID=A0A420XH20_9PAST|nr:iron chelate uptake ABC transporter family permease subunit [Otariodibacter oris]QGM80068.1 iron ABC transporter permease [Otariodibacter oris]RKR71893.1 iron complex transport system permease protein [Otariodibacter oris]
MLNSNYKRLLFLTIITVICIGLYLGYQLPSRWQYAIYYRSLTLAAIVLTGIAIALSTMLFQILINNRILTPSVLGLDSLYVLLYTTVVFLFGGKLVDNLDVVSRFIYSNILMLFFALLLYRFILRNNSSNLYFLLLIGIICNTFFHSVSLFMEVLIDPNEYQIIQDVSFASFSHINTTILPLALGIIVIPIIYIFFNISILNVLTLGRDQAISLGVDYNKISKRLLIIIALLVSVSTALVGPIMFLGLIVMNLTFEFIRSNRYQILLPASMLIAIITLLGGQFIISQLLNFSTSISVVINFFGGLYFLYLILGHKVR